ncbi:BTAD domain-containing putative transcriptional regulator [Kribbella shirazensis]|uniref:Putative ATPase/DNA-binding SARP family transcriptional activator n=1 Tax=Kribbella shirazensis TaxID=1105143 RepID=A0A7X5V6Z6_9ACTN|nr:BTAD domain-containing putative transcriptional regulator [Kribbella shirazensis]NIK55366.1 putative ATPase/DNA-binding SARP family transcriptional activator [Kribbella shirazensis]
MYFGVLGPLLVRTDAGEPVAVPDTKVRTLLLDLLANEGRPVSADRLIDDLWGTRPPRNATGTLQARVSQLRTALERAEPGARRLVEHGPAGYRLATDVVDSNVFEQRIRTGRLREALGLWRGQAYADVRDHEFARATRDRLEDLYVTALEELSNRGEEVLQETTALVQQRPLDERLHAIHLKALYRAGRQHDALQAFAELRDALVEELGADPGPELAELHQAILRHDPALRRPPTLPTPLNDLVGRDEMLAAAQQQLATNRLVTLVGPGGVGKTRLAVELGRQHGTDVRLLELAPLRQGEVLDALATALSLRDESSDLLPRLLESLGSRQLLLILDNCEHLDLAGLVRRLLAAAPGLRILATSREPLGLTGELVLDVPPLTTAAAVVLFQARAGVTDDVTAICERLDGIPLALELAATRVRALGVQGLADRLDDRFRLLAGGKGGPERQRTLRATIDWSWDLLDDDERRMLRRLAVHAGTFSLEAAAQVSDLPEHLVLALVDKSLVVATAGRYHLLESVAAYSLERLTEAGEEAETRRKHATYYLALAQRADLHGPGQREWLRRLDQEVANFRVIPPSLELATALAWYWYLRGRLGEARRTLAAALAVPGQDPALRGQAMVWLAGMAATDAEGTDVAAAGEEALRAVGDDPHALWFLTMTRWAYGDASVLTDRIDRAIAAFTERDDRWGLAAALSTRAQLSIVHADLDAMRRDSLRSLELFEELDDDWGRLQATYALIVAAEISGDYPTATAYLEDAIRRAEDLGLWTEVSFRTAGLGRIALLTGDYARADELHERARRLAVEQSNKSAEEYAEVGLGLSARRQGRLDDAERLFTKWLRWLTQIGGTPGIAFISNQLGFIAEERGDLATARTLHERGHEAARRTGDPRAVALALEGLAGATEDPTEAEALLTQAETLRHQSGIPLPPAEHHDLTRIRARWR